MTTVEKIAELTADQLKLNAAEINADTKIKDDMHADSLDVAQILFAIEDEYGIELPTEEAIKLETVGQVAEMVDRLVEAK